MLVPGRKYRITDYVAYGSALHNMQSANHAFDIIVTADNERMLNEKAQAVMHENVYEFSTAKTFAIGDYCKYNNTVYKCTTAHHGAWNASNFTEEAPYFYGSNLSAWDVRYCIDNDTTRFKLANQNGKGFVYRLIDEWLNDCPYDFKGVRFSRSEDGTTVWRYTFDSGAEESGADWSLSSVHKVYCNTLGSGTYNIVFLGEKCYNNTIGAGCYAITINGECSNTEIGNDSHDITLGINCYQNKIGTNCSGIQLGSTCYGCDIGKSCGAITFGSNCTYNIICQNCTVVAFGTYCTYNRIGANNSYVEFGDRCGSVTTGIYCKWIGFKGYDAEQEEYVRRNRFQYINFADAANNVYIDRDNPTSTGIVRYVTIEHGVKGSNSSTPKIITLAEYNQNHQTVFRPTDVRVVTV